MCTESIYHCKFQLLCLYDIILYDIYDFHSDPCGNLEGKKSQIFLNMSVYNCILIYSCSILEALNKMLVTQDCLVTEIKGLRQDVDGLHRRMSAMDSPKHRAALRASTSQESASPLSTQSWASILVALIFYSLIQWLVEKIRS